MRDCNAMITWINQSSIGSNNIALRHERLTILHFYKTSYTCPSSLTELMLHGRVFLQLNFPLPIETFGMQWPWARAPSQTNCSPRPVTPGMFCMFLSQGRVLVATCEHLSQALEPGPLLPAPLLSKSNTHSLRGPL